MSQIPLYFKSFGSLGRHWYKRKIPQHLKKTKYFEFTVASYNILADQLMEDNPHLYYAGKSKDATVFDWDYRKHNLLKEIECANADILCLQEVEEEHYYDWFNPHLKANGYSGVYKKRSGDKVDGCAIFFKDDVFSLQLCHMIDYYRKYVPMMDRNNVAVIVFLSPSNKSLSNLGPICVTNTHLLFNKQRGDIKLTQLAHLFADIDALAKVHATNYKYVPIIMCGDFNSLPDSPLYNLITTGELQYEGLSKYLVSGQTHGYEDRYHAFGEVLFPSDVGISDKCKWKSSKRKRTLDDFINPMSITATLSLLCNENSKSSELIKKDCTESMELIKQDRKRARLKSNLHNGYNGSCDVILVSDEEEELSNTSSKQNTINNPFILVTDKEKEPSKMLNKKNIVDNPVVVIIDSDDKYNPLVAATNSDEDDTAKPGYLTHDFSLQSSYFHYCLDGEPEITTCHDRDAANVDYIFYSCEKSVQDADIERLWLGGVLGLLSETELDDMDKLPNKFLSSDHLLLMASFILRE